MPTYWDKFCDEHPRAHEDDRAYLERFWHWLREQEINIVSCPECHLQFGPWWDHTGRGEGVSGSKVGLRW